jgi:hypothetical protein
MQRYGRIRDSCSWSVILLGGVMLVIEAQQTRNRRARANKGPSYWMYEA